MEAAAAETVALPIDFAAWSEIVEPVTAVDPAPPPSSAVRLVAAKVSAPLTTDWPMPRTFSA